MQRKLTVELSTQEVKQAIQEYVSKITQDEVSEIVIDTSSRIGEPKYTVFCKTAQFGNENEQTQEAPKN